MYDPTKPVVENIALAIIDCLESEYPTRPDTPYPSSVVRLKQVAEFSPEHLMAIIIQEDPTRDEDHSYAGNPGAAAWVQPFRIRLIVRQNDTAEAEFNNRFVAGVVHALSHDPQWGGLAIDTEMTPPETVKDTDGELAGVELTLEVTYRHADGDPYERR